MNSFLRRLMTITVLLIGSLLILQIIISNRIIDKSVNGQDNLEQTICKNPDVIFLGSSRILATINPNLFREHKIRCENLGAHGQGIRFAIARYKNYLAKNLKSPRIIVCSLEPIFESGFSTFMKDRFSRYCWNSSPKDSQLLNYFRFNWLEKNIPSYSVLKYRKFWDCVLLNNQSSWLSDGMEHRFGEICSEQKSNAEFVSIGYNLLEMGEQIQILKILASQNNAKLIFLQLPFYHQNNPATIRQFNLTNKICDRYSLDIINLYDDKYNTDCSIFADPYHFNSKGSDIITKEVLQVIQQRIESD